MKRRLLSVLLAMMLILSCVPTVWGVDETFYVGGSNRPADIPEGAEWYPSFTDDGFGIYMSEHASGNITIELCEDDAGNLMIDNDNITQITIDGGGHKMGRITINHSKPDFNLVFTSDCTVSNDNGNGIYIENGGGNVRVEKGAHLTIHASGTDLSAGICIRGNSSVTVEEGAKLTIEAESFGILSLWNDCSVTVDGTAEITSRGNSFTSAGINFEGSGSVTVGENGELKIDADGDGIRLGASGGTSAVTVDGTAKITAQGNHGIRFSYDGSLTVGPTGNLEVDAEGNGIHFRNDGDVTMKAGSGLSVEGKKYAVGGGEPGNSVTFTLDGVPQKLNLAGGTGLFNSDISNVTIEPDPDDPSTDPAVAEIVRELQAEIEENNKSYNYKAPSGDTGGSISPGPSYSIVRPVGGVEEYWAEPPAVEEETSAGEAGIAEAEDGNKDNPSMGGAADAFFC